MDALVELINGGADLGEQEDDDMEIDLVDPALAIEEAKASMRGEMEEMLRVAMGKLALTREEDSRARGKEEMERKTREMDEHARREAQALKEGKEVERRKDAENARLNSLTRMMNEKLAVAVAATKVELAKEDKERRAQDWESLDGRLKQIETWCGQVKAVIDKKPTSKSAMDASPTSHQASSDPRLQRGELHPPQPTVVSPSPASRQAQLPTSSLPSPASPRPQAAALPAYLATDDMRKFIKEQIREHTKQYARRRARTSASRSLTASTAFVGRSPTRGRLRRRCQQSRCRRDCWRGCGTKLERRMRR